MEKDYWKLDDNSWNFGRKSTEICRKMKDHQELMNDFHRARKIKNLPAKFCAVGPKTKTILKMFKKILRFLIKISMENWHHNFYYIFLGFLTPLQYLWKITLDFNNNFSDFGGGGDIPAFPPPFQTLLEANKALDNAANHTYSNGAWISFKES